MRLGFDGLGRPDGRRHLFVEGCGYRLFRAADRLYCHRIRNCRAFVRIKLSESSYQDGRMASLQQKARSTDSGRFIIDVRRRILQPVELGTNIFSTVRQTLGVASWTPVQVEITIAWQQVRCSAGVGGSGASGRRALQFSSVDR